MPSTDCWCRAQTGEVVIRGQNVTAGYANDPQANAAAYSEGWFHTGDEGRLDEDGYLFLTGRLKEMINRGGEKISPREVDEVLMDHPAVLQAVTFALPHPTLGEDVAAAVVLRPGAAATESDLRALAFDRLADFKVPSQVLIVDRIPAGPTGKLQRIGLAAHLARALRHGYAAPRNPLEQVLAAIEGEVLGLDQVSVQDNFFALGGDSLRATQVVTRLRAVLQVDVPIPELFHHPTIAALASDLLLQHPELGDPALGELLAEVQGLSEEEAQRLLQDEALPTEPADAAGASLPGSGSA